MTSSFCVLLGAPVFAFFQAGALDFFFVLSGAPGCSRQLQQDEQHALRRAADVWRTQDAQSALSCACAATNSTDTSPRSHS